MINLEIEFKTLMTIDEFRRLDSLYQHVKPVHQTNYYIDTAKSLLKSKKLSLRIRTFGDRAELTLKIPQKIGNIEYNEELDIQEAREMRQQLVLPPGDIRDKLLERHVPLEDLQILGSLTTRRRETQTPIGLMAIDSNQYAGIKDYELELEVTDPVQGQKDFLDFLDKHQINFKYAKSKVARFVATQRKQKKSDDKN